MNRRLALRSRAQTQIEHPDPTPVEINVQTRPQTLREQLQAYVRQQVSLQAQELGHGTFEEEDDFEDDENDEWFSPHELRHMQDDTIPGEPAESLDGNDQTPAPVETPASEPIEASPESGGSA